MSKPNLAVLLAGLLWGIPLAHAVPQDPSVVTEGARVRVTLQSPDRVSYTGTIVALRLDTLVLAPERRVDSVVVPVGMIRNFAISRGRASPLRGALKGAGIGFGLGSAVGLLVLASSGCFDFSFDISSERLTQCTPGAENTGLLIILGAGVVGTVVGAARRHERWVNVPTNRLHASIGARGIGLTVSF